MPCNTVSGTTSNRSLVVWHCGSNQVLAVYVPAAAGHLCTSLGAVQVWVDDDEQTEALAMVVRTGTCENLLTGNTVGS